MRSSADKADAVAEALATLEEVEDSVVTTGSYPVLIWVAAESVEELGNLLRTRIGGIDGVRKTQTFLNLSIKKRGFGRVQYRQGFYSDPSLLEGGRFGGRTLYDRDGIFKYCHNRHATQPILQSASLHRRRTWTAERYRIGGSQSCHRTRTGSTGTRTG